MSKKAKLTRRVIALGIILIFSVCNVSALPAPTVSFTEGFDNYTTGVPAGWTKNGGTVAPVSSDYGTAVQLTAQGIRPQLSYVLGSEFAASTAGKVFCMEGDFYFLDVSSRSLFDVKMGPDGSSWRFPSFLTTTIGGQIVKTKNTSDAPHEPADTVVGTYEKDEWYNIKIIANFSTSLFDVFITKKSDGSVQHTSGLRFHINIPNGIYLVGFSQYDGGAHNSMYVDNVKVYNNAFASKMSFSVDSEPVMSFSQLNPDDVVDLNVHTASGMTEDTPVTMIFALYQNGKLKSVDVKPVTLLTTDFVKETPLQLTMPPESTAGCELKAFIWNGVDMITPISGVTSIKDPAQ